MSKLPAFFAGALVALITMSSPVNLLALFGGQFSISLIFPLLMLGLLLGIKIFFTQFGRSKLLLANTNQYLLFFLLLATLSLLWSDFPGVTAYNLYRLYAIFFICLAFSMTSWNPKKFSITMQSAMLFLTLGSIIYYFINPADAIQDSVSNGVVLLELVDAWKGITYHKNALGTVSSMAVIICFHALYTRTGSRLYSAIGLLTAAICLIKSRSSTSLFAALFAIALILLIMKSPLVKKRFTIRIFSTVLAVFFLVYSLGVLNIVPGLSSIVEPIVAMTGKDMTFSGRTGIWGIMQEEIYKHPLLGTGYAAFWLGSDNPLFPSYIFKIRIFFYPGEAHNGYLDILNELGILGVLALIAYLFTILRQAVFLIPADRKKAALFIGLLFSEFIANMSEAHWWNRDSVNFIVLTLASFDLARAIQEAKQKKIRNSTNPVSAPNFQKTRMRSANGSRDQKTEE